MNNNIVKFAFVGIACATFCTATFAAPRGGHTGGNHGGNGRPARAAQPARPAHDSHAARPAARPNTPNKAHHAAPAQPTRQPTVARHGNTRPEPRHHAPPPRVEHRHHAPPPRVGHRNIPSHAHYCARPAVPLWRIGALRAWEWIEEAWMIVVNGIYYYGDGYYYDGYNYYYNGAYHTVPPTPVFV